MSLPLDWPGSPVVAEGSGRGSGCGV